MKKILLSLLACAYACGMAWAFEEPTEGTIDAQKWYTINSKSRGGCLTVTHAGTLQHVDETPLTSYWRIIIPEDNTEKTLADGVYVRNFNGKYLTVAGLSDTATKVYLGKSREENISDTYYVICTSKDTNESGQPSADCIDANDYDNNVGAWHGETIDGYSWGFSLVDDTKLPVVPEISSATSPKYYKVVSNRGISGKGYSDGPYLKVDGETATTSAIGESTGMSALTNGSYWYLTADDGTTAIGDGVYLHNLISDQLLNSGSPTTMTTEGTKVYLAYITGKTKSGGSNTIFDLNTYAISNAALNDGEPNSGSCMDQSNNSPYTQKFVWHPYSDEDNGDYNNGSSWYFLLASDDEVATAEKNYISSLSSALPSSTPVELTYCGNLSEIFDADKVNAATDKIHFDASQYTTAAAAIPAVREFKSSGTLSETQNTELQAAMKEIYASAIGKELQFCMQGSAYFLGVNGSGLWSYGDGKSNVNTIWKIEEGATDGQYILHNYGTDKYASKVDFTGSGVQVPVVATSAEAYNNYSFIQGGDKYNNGTTNMVRIFNNTTEGDLNNKAYFYCNGENAKVSIWGNGHPNTIWAVSQAAYDEAATPTATVDDKTITISLADGSLAAGLSDAAIAITATKASAEAEIAAIADDDADQITATTSADDNTVTITLDDYGTYNVTIPAGYFVTSAGAFTSAKTLTVTATETTSISEVESAAATAAPAAIYDLQGRRVARATKGFYIINGQKTLMR